MTAIRIVRTGIVGLGSDPDLMEVGHTITIASVDVNRGCPAVLERGSAPVYESGQIGSETAGQLTEARARAAARDQLTFENSGGAPRIAGRPDPEPATGQITVEVTDN